MTIAILYLIVGLLMSVLLYWIPNKKSVGLFITITVGWLPLFVIATMVTVFFNNQHGLNENRHLSS